MKKRLLSILTILACTSLFAQVGIGTITPSNAAMLEVSNTSDNIVYGGFMPPRFDNEAQRDLINPTPADYGLMVFVVDAGTSGTPANSGCLQLWTGVIWENIHCTGATVVVPPNNIPWINEIHYDDDTSPSDIDEGIEIAGLAGINLTDYQLIMYTGSSGNVYDTIGLLSTIPDEGTGTGAVWIDYPGLQNGTPDGVALYNATTSTVIQFLSYEGPFLANGGPAAGMTSTDIGVEENNSTPAGFSLQLIGSGDEYGDFNWQAPAAHSRGLINTSQTITN